MKKFITLFVVFSTIPLAYSQQDEARKEHYNIKKNIALEGYDPVSYFDSKPSEGSEKLKFVYKGIIYLFANTTNLNKFKVNPEKYEPMYGGWCAYAMGASGEKVKVDPETFKILDGKLYVFYNFWGSNTLADWNKNEKALRLKADQNWKMFIPIK